MDRAEVKDLLKRRLRLEVARFCRRDHRLWKKPIVQTLRELRDTSTRAVLFGGTLRSLLASRLFDRKPGRPRDVDIVVSGTTVDDLKEVFREIVTRETRFGGLQLRRVDWQFDLWPLHATWAFVRDDVENPEFSFLPETTFFNMEAIAVDVWAEPGKPRRIYSGNDQFFDGLISETLEVNREENPFPELCVVRALTMASKLRFDLGPRLTAYVAQVGRSMEPDQLEDIQRAHYGGVRREGVALRDWIRLIGEHNSKDQSSTFRLPIARQRELWPRRSGRLHVHVSLLNGRT